MHCPSDGMEPTDQTKRTGPLAMDCPALYKKLWNSEYRFRPTRAFAFLAITSATWFYIDYVIIQVTNYRYTNTPYEI